MNDSPGPRELLVLFPHSRFDSWTICFERLLSALLLDGVDFEFDEQGNIPVDLPADLGRYRHVLIFSEDADHYRERLRVAFPRVDAAIEQQRQGESMPKLLSPQVTPSRDGRQFLHLIKLGVFKSTVGLGALNDLYWRADLPMMSPAFQRRQVSRSDEAVIDQLLNRLTMDPARMCPRRCRFAKLWTPRGGGAAWSEFDGNIQRCLMDLAHLTGRADLSDMAEQSIRLYLSELRPDDTLLCGDPWSLMQSIQHLYEKTGETELLEHLRRRLRIRDRDYIAWNGMYSTWFDDRWIRDGSLFLMVVAAVRAAAFSDDPAAIYRQAVHQAITTEKMLRDETTGLFHFGYNGRQRTPLLIGHGTMWHMLAYSELLTCFPREHVDYERIAQVFRRLAEAAARVQDAQGLWHQQINRPDTSSADIIYSSVITGALYRGLSIGVLDRNTFEPVARRGMDGYKLRSFRGCVCGGAVSCGLSPSPRYYIERPINNDFSYGGWHQLFPAVEYLRYTQQDRP